MRLCGLFALHTNYRPFGGVWKDEDTRKVPEPGLSANRSHCRGVGLMVQLVKDQLFAIRTRLVGIVVTQWPDCQWLYHFVTITISFRIGKARRYVVRHGAGFGKPSARSSDWLRGSRVGRDCRL